MASEGPLFPTAAANLSNAGTSESAEAWVNPTNVFSDNATEAAITAATYDSPDISQILVASTFGFASVAGTVNGITVEIDRRSIILNSGKDFRVQLAKGTAFANLVGTNKAVPATIWPTTSTVATYGGAADLWGTTWTAAEIKASSFAVFLSCQANIANADVGVDFVRVTVTYTPPTDTNPQPTAASLTVTGDTPTVAVTANQLAAPFAAALTTTGATPAVSTPVATAPTVASLTTTGAVPVIAASAIPSAASLTATGSVPAIVLPVGVAPTALSLVTTGAAPAIALPVATAPTAAALVTTGAVADVQAGADQDVHVTPGSVSLVVTLATPTVTVTANVRVSPSAAAIALAFSAPTIGVTQNRLVLPAPLALTVRGERPRVDNGEAKAPTAALLRQLLAVPVVIHPQPGHLVIGGAPALVVIIDDGDFADLLERIA